MPEILPDHVPSPRTLLTWDGTAYRSLRGHTDGTLQVRGEDQLFSFRSTLDSSVTGIISGAGGYIAPPGPVAGQVWVITAVAAMNQNNAITGIRAERRVGCNIFTFWAVTAAIPANQWTAAARVQLAYNPHQFRCYFPGALVGDTVTFTMTGYIMTLET